VSRRRIFHVPSHLDYVSKLVGPSFAPVPSPSGGPLTVAALLALDLWDFFDVLHVHTVELATAEQLAELVDRLRHRRKGLVFTVHDLVPNIETDPVAFDEKTRLLVKEAAGLITLTGLAADTVVSRLGRRPVVVPHGIAVAPPVVRRTGDPVRREPGLLAFGALRPNRRLVAMVRAWCRLPADRPPLSIVLRSVGPADRERYRIELDELAAADEPGLSVELIDRVLSPAELVDRCRVASALVLPYRSVTHSGQLELARDLGLGAVLPDVPTLRAQLAGADHPCVWFPPAALDEPDVFARYLAAAPPPAAGVPDREGEHAELLRAHELEYRSAGGRPFV
jgi:glycosyltransferase involved in cell wall biosynthesis